MAKKSLIVQRKVAHLDIVLSGRAEIGDAGFSKYKFIHNALPEINFDNIDLTTTFLGKNLKAPLLISCMTGGVEHGLTINRNLAETAQRLGIAMGVGSQRIGIVKPDLSSLFLARSVAPDILLFGNIGAVQLNYGFGLKEAKQAVKMIEADALVLHLNPIQEIVQPEGDHNFENLIPKIESLVKGLGVPIIVKEVGNGLSEDTARRLYAVGVKVVDTAGWGGTSWPIVEGIRGKREWLGQAFGDWGIPTTESIIACKQVKGLKVIGSGGVRSGIDVAKAIALGADLVGIAAPFANQATKSAEAVQEYAEQVITELKLAMFGVGASSINELQKVKLSAN